MARLIYTDETFGWGEVTQNLIAVDLEGGHSSMLQEPFVEPLAAELMPRIGYIGYKSEPARSRSVEPEIP